MKKIIFSLFLVFSTVIVDAQTAQTNNPNLLSNRVVDIACGECKFKMKGKSCDLAIRIDGKSYFVDGKTVDDFGDAHAKHGFCNAISKATVTGEIIGDRFKAKAITLIPSKKKA